MSIIVPPGSSHHGQRSYHRQIQKTGDGFTAFVELAGLVLGLTLAGALALAAYASVVVLTPAAWQTLVTAAASEGPGLSLQAVLIQAGFGALAGLLIGLARRARMLKSRLAGSAVSSASRPGWLTADPSFLLIVVVSTLVGAAVGGLTAAGGVAPVAEVFADGSGLSGAGGAALLGLGGSGGPGGLFGSLGGVGIFLLIVLVLLIQALILGAALGLLSHAVLGGVLGLFKGAAKGTAQALAEGSGRVGLLEQARRGLVQGAITGAVVGLVQGILASVLVLGEVPSAVALPPAGPERLAGPAASSTSSSSPEVPFRGKPLVPPVIEPSALEIVIPPVPVPPPRLPQLPKPDLGPPVPAPRLEPVLPNLPPTPQPKLVPPRPRVEPPPGKPPLE